MQATSLEGTLRDVREWLGTPLVPCAIFQNGELGLGFWHVCADPLRSPSRVLYGVCFTLFARGLCMNPIRPRGPRQPTLYSGCAKSLKSAQKPKIILNKVLINSDCTL